MFDGNDAGAVKSNSAFLLDYMKPPDEDQMRRDNYNVRMAPVRDRLMIQTTMIMLRECQ